MIIDTVFDPRRCEICKRRIPIRPSSPHHTCNQCGAPSTESDASPPAAESAGVIGGGS